MKKLIALDVDGTVLRHNGLPSTPTIGRVLRQVAKEHYLVFVTGRSTGEMIPVLRKFRLTGPLAPPYLACCNGAVGLKLGNSKRPGYIRASLKSFWPSRLLRSIFKLMPAAEIAIEDLCGVYHHTPGFPAYMLNEELVLSSRSDLLGLEATRVILYTPSARSQSVMQSLKQNLGSGVNCTNGWNTWTDIMPPGVNKSTALRWMANELGIQPEGLVCAGDGHNDIEMLSWTKQAGGLSLAMDQASAEVRAAAGQVVGKIGSGDLERVLMDIESYQTRRAVRAAEGAGLENQ